MPASVLVVFVWWFAQGRFMITTCSKIGHIKIPFSGNVMHPLAGSPFWWGWNISEKPLSQVEMDWNSAHIQSQSWEAYVAHSANLNSRHTARTWAHQVERASISYIWPSSQPRLSRVGLFIECLPYEIQHAHCCESQSKESYLSFKGNIILFWEKTCSKN